MYLGSLSMHGARLKPRSSWRCSPDCNAGAVIRDQPQKTSSKLSSTTKTTAPNHIARQSVMRPQRCGEPDFPCLKQIPTGNITAAPDASCEQCCCLQETLGKHHQPCPVRREGEKAAKLRLLEHFNEKPQKENPSGRLCAAAARCLRRSWGRGQRLAALLPAPHKYASSECAELNVSGATRAFQPAHAPGLTLRSSGTLPAQEQGRCSGLHQAGRGRAEGWQGEAMITAVAGFNPCPFSFCRRAVALERAEREHISCEGLRGSRAACRGCSGPFASSEG